MVGGASAAHFDRFSRELPMGSSLVGEPALRLCDQARNHASACVWLHTPAAMDVRCVAALPQAAKTSRVGPAHPARALDVLVSVTANRTSVPCYIGISHAPS